MYKYLSKLTDNECDAILLSEGRIRIVGCNQTENVEVAAKHYLFMVDYMHVPADEILFLSINDKQTKEIKNTLAKCDAQECVDNVFSIVDFCVNFLHEEIGILGLSDKFAILSDSEKIMIALDINKRVHRKISSLAAEVLLGQIYAEKKINPTYIESLLDWGFNDSNLKRGDFYEYIKHQRYLIKYDELDLLYFTLRILSQEEYVYKKWNRKYKYFIIAGIEEISSNVVSLIELLTPMNAANIYHVLNLVIADKKENTFAINYFNNNKFDEIVYLRNSLQALHNSVLQRIRKRKEEEEKQKLRKAKETKQKYGLICNILDSVSDYVIKYNPLGRLQYWVVNKDEDACKYFLMRNTLLNYLYRGNIYINNAFRTQAEFIKNEETYDTGSDNIKLFNSWWNISTVIQDNDIIILHDKDNNIVRGIGRFIGTDDNSRDIIWIDNQRRIIPLVYNHNAWNPVRIEDEDCIKKLNNIVNSIIRGY